VLLPETLGMPIPDTIEDVSFLYKNPKKWYKWMPKKELEILQMKTREEKMRGKVDEQL